MKCLRDKDGTTHYLAIIPDAVLPTILGGSTPTELALLKYLLEKEQRTYLGHKCSVFSAFSGEKSFLDYISPAYIEKTAKTIAKARKQKYKQQNYCDAFHSLLNRLYGIEQVAVFKTEWW